MNRIIYMASSCWIFVCWSLKTTQEAHRENLLVAIQFNLLVSKTEYITRLHLLKASVKIKQNKIVL